MIRAGLVQKVSTTLGLWQLERRTAYLSGDDLVASPFVQAFQVEEQLAYQLKTIRRRLREQKAGMPEIKKRRVALDPDALGSALKLRGDESLTLILTRAVDKPIVVLCRRKDTREGSETSRV